MSIIFKKNNLHLRMKDGNYTNINTIGVAGSSGTDKMDKENPTGTGSFSMNRQDNSDIGQYSTTLGKENIASGDFSTAEGDHTTASGNSSHAEGYYTTSSGMYSHAEGANSATSGSYSHAEGYYTTASGSMQHVSGKFNVSDDNNTYSCIVGGGSSDSDRKNIYTLDWNGNAVFSGDVTITASDGTQYSLLDIVNLINAHINQS